MSERPGVLFGSLLAIAATGVFLLAVALAGLGGSGVIDGAATLIGASSACAFFLGQLHTLPLASVALVTLTLASLFGLLRAVIRYRRERGIVRALLLERIASGPLAAIAREAGTDCLYLARSSRPAAFCTGLIRPRVVVTSGLLTALDPVEQASVVWHEAQHARVREPLRCLIGELIVSSLFWMPALADLRGRYLLARELDADRAATSQMGQRALAGALHAVMLEPAYAGTVGIGDVAAARIDRLFDPTATLPRTFKPLRLAISAVTLAGLATLLAAPIDLTVEQPGQFNSMLTSVSRHGLPGMAVGLVVNAAIIACIGLGLRRLAKRNTSD